MFLVAVLGSTHSSIYYLRNFSSPEYINMVTKEMQMFRKTLNNKLIFFHAKIFTTSSLPQCASTKSM